jgi:hypothetical protein
MYGRCFVAIGIDGYTIELANGTTEVIPTSRPGAELGLEINDYWIIFYSGDNGDIFMAFPRDSVISMHAVPKGVMFND